MALGPRLCCTGNPFSATSTKNEHTRGALIEFKAEQRCLKHVHTDEASENGVVVYLLSYLVPFTSLVQSQTLDQVPWDWPIHFAKVESWDIHRRAILFRANAPHSPFEIRSSGYFCCWLRPKRISSSEDCDDCRQRSQGTPMICSKSQDQRVALCHAERSKQTGLEDLGQVPRSKQPPTALLLSFPN